MELTFKPHFRSRSESLDRVAALQQYATAVNLLFRVRLVAYCDVVVEHRFQKAIIYLLGFRVASSASTNLYSCKFLHKQKVQPEILNYLVPNLYHMSRTVFICSLTLLAFFFFFILRRIGKNKA